MKAALRRSLRQRRRSLHAAGGDAGRELIRSFAASGLSLPAVAAVYLPQGSEIDPRPLAEWLAARGVRIALPVVAAPGRPLVFREAAAEAGALDALGLPVPPAHAPALRPDLVFAPLLGFDRGGGRIGQGGGYYDRTLAVLRGEGGPVLAVGLAYAGQEVERAPTDPTDEPLDGVLTERGYLSFA